jgi:hypothetical protein
MVKELISKYYKSSEFLNLADSFIADPSLLHELVDIATSELPHPFPEYASWLLIHIAKKAPNLIEPFNEKIIDSILISTNQSVLRNLMNTSVSLQLTEYKESDFLDKTIQFISTDSYKVALFVYSIYKLIQFTHKYPEIKPEILGIIDLKRDNEMKPAMKIGIRNYLKETKNS